VILNVLTAEIETAC